ncbi:MAG: hypothetical protein PHY47_15935 [Lachnospiraceae bacterium]|nr:hypothetical protein [Lachnospiraceae bacterium]
MNTWNSVESTEKTLLYEEIDGIVYVRKNIELIPGTDDKPDMYHYQEKKMLASEYTIYEDYERLQSDVDFIAMEMGVVL